MNNNVCPGSTGKQDMACIKLCYIAIVGTKDQSK